MNSVAKDFGSYIKDLFSETVSMILTLFSVLGVILFLQPKLATQVNDDEIVLRTIGVSIFFVSFIATNFVLYRKYLAVKSTKAAIKLRIQKYEFGRPYGTRPIRKDGFERNNGGFSNNGMPDWGTLWARIEIVNTGSEEGELILGKADIKFPTLFLKNDWQLSFDPNPLINARTQNQEDFFFDILFTEKDPVEFAKKINATVSKNHKFRVALPYKTKTLDGESKWSHLIITDNFRDFHSEIIKYWTDNGFDHLAKLAKR